MRKVNIPEFREEVLAIINASREKITSIKGESDYSPLTFSGKNYTCEITLNDKWIGYDLEITTPNGTAGCGMRNDTDIYPIYGEGYEEVAIEIYDELLSTVKALFNGRMYYWSDDKYSYTARKNEDDTYSVDYWERKKFLFWPYSSGWTDKEYSQSEFEKLELKVLS